MSGLLLALVAGLVQWKSRGKRLALFSYVMALAGWSLAAQFLLKPLVPHSVVAAVLLGGITAGILAAAVIGKRRTNP